MHTPNGEFNGGEEMVPGAGEERAPERGACFDVVLLAEPIAAPEQVESVDEGVYEAYMRYWGSTSTKERGSIVEEGRAVVYEKGRCCVQLNLENNDHRCVMSCELPNLEILTSSCQLAHFNQIFDRSTEVTDANDH